MSLQTRPNRMVFKASLHWPPWNLPPPVGARGDGFGLWTVFGRGGGGCAKACFWCGTSDGRLGGQAGVSTGEPFVPDALPPIPYPATPNTAHPTTTAKPASPRARPQPLRWLESGVVWPWGVAGSE